MKCVTTISSGALLCRMYLIKDCILFEFLRYVANFKRMSNYKVSRNMAMNLFFAFETYFVIKQLKTEPRQFYFNLASCMDSHGQVLTNSTCMCIVSWQLGSEDVFGLSLTDACTQGPFWAEDLRTLCVCLLVCKHNWACAGVCVCVLSSVCCVNVCRLWL